MRFGIFYSLMTNASFSSQSHLLEMFDVWWLNYHYYKSHTVLFFYYTIMVYVKTDMTDEMMI